jgi:hypothetical protein
VSLIGEILEALSPFPTTGPCGLPPGSGASKAERAAYRSRVEWNAAEELRRFDAQKAKMNEDAYPLDRVAWTTGPKGEIRMGKYVAETADEKTKREADEKSYRDWSKAKQIRERAAMLSGGS